MRNILRKITVFSVATAMVLGLAACGKKTSDSDKKDTNINIEKMAYSLINGNIFDSDMSEYDDDNARYILNYSDFKDIVMYGGSGGTADEILVIECNSVDSANDVRTAVDTHISAIKKSYQDYDAVQYDKASKAVEVKNGRYVVMCISNDSSKATAIINDVFAGKNVSDKIVSGGNVQPTEPSETDSSEENTSTEAPTEPASTEPAPTEPAPTEPAPTEPAPTEPAPTEPAPTEPPTVPPVPSNPSDPGFNFDAGIRYYSHSICVGNAAYENYGYDENSAVYYANVINGLADKLAGKANVYDILIPLCIGLQFPDSYKNQVTVEDQNAAIDRIDAKLNGNVKAINIFPTLAAHKNEYLYFRTDHHWSGLAAYYAYTDFCAKKGIAAHGLGEYATITFPGFLGSFAIDTQDAILLNSPDTVTAYYPINNSSLNMTITDSNGNTRGGVVIYDETNNSAANKYGTYIMGDNPFVTITNSNINDGSACVVIKESFGNAFVPFLTDHYQTVYVVDYRYWTGTISSLVDQKGIQDVIFVNNLSMTRGSYSIGQMAKVSQ